MKKFYELRVNDIVKVEHNQGEYWSIWKLIAKPQNKQFRAELIDGSPKEYWSPSWLVAKTDYNRENITLVINKQTNPEYYL